MSNLGLYVNCFIVPAKYDMENFRLIKCHLLLSSFEEITS